MKASEVIQQLKNLIFTHGDLHVGFYNMEYYCFETISSISVKKHDEGAPFADAEELGKTFIAIEDL